MDKLVEAMLAIGSRFTEVDLTSSVRERMSVNADAFAIALHAHLLVRKAMHNNDSHEFPISCSHQRFE